MKPEDLGYPNLGPRYRPQRIDKRTPTKQNEKSKSQGIKDPLEKRPDIPYEAKHLKREVGPGPPR